MFNLNDASFDAKEGIAIFNDGIAGVVENVTVSVSRKTAEDKEMSPDFKLIFTDSSGASTNMPFWYIKEATAYASVDEQVKKQGTVLKHVIHAIYGKDFVIPVTASTAQQLLDQCMKVIKDGLVSGVQFRVFANYGSTQSVKKYIQVRSWVPFMENMTVTESRLEVSKIDAMVRLEADNVATSGAQGTAVANTDDW